MGFKPTQWVRKASAQKMCLNGAHRGGRSLGPENTLCTAIRGYLAGADFWELDVQWTADEHLVVTHDPDLKRTSNAEALFPDRAPWSVFDFTWEEIRRLDFGTWFNVTDPYKQFAQGLIDEDFAASFVGTNVPSLLEALLLTRALDWRVNVEIKDQSHYRNDCTIVDKVLRLVHSLEMKEQVLVSSFNLAYLERTRELDRSIATGVLVEELPDDPAALVRSLSADALHPPARAVNVELIRSLEAERIPVNTWTVNDPSSMKDLIRTGVGGIITDFPQVLEPLRSGPT